MIYTKFGVCSKKGDFRKNNEDRASVFINHQGYLLAVVCDGMGGHYGGETASRLTLEKIKSSFLNHFFKSESLEDVEIWSNITFKKISQELHEYALRNEDYNDMGTTIVATLVMHTKIYFLNIGDSRAYYHVKNFLNLITKDQNYKNTLIETQNMTEEEARIHPNANSLVSCMGPAKNYVCDIYHTDIATGTVILCTDGVYGVVSDLDLKTIALRPLTPLEKAEELVKISLKKKTKDNTTCAIIDIYKAEVKNESNI